MSLNKEDVLIEVTRRRCWTDLFYFAKYVLGFNLMEIDPHKELCDVLMALAQPLFPDIKFDITTPWVLEMMAHPDEIKRKALVMLPRGSFKSTVATVGFSVWLLWHNPNIRILIDTETLSNAKLYLGAIKGLIMENPLLQQIAVDEKGTYLLAPNFNIPGGFNEDSLILASRTKLGIKEPTIFCSGVDNARTGMHMEVLIADDLVSERNVTTPEQIEKTKNHYRMALSLLEPTGAILLIIGTRYHMDDLYNELLVNPSFWVIVRPAILPNGTLYFPNRLTEDFLEQQKRDQGSYIFASQYMLSPIAGDTTPFKDIDIIRYDKNKSPVFTKKFITVDLAVSEKETADDRVVMAFGSTAQQQIYVLEYINGIFTPFKHMDYIFTLAEKYGILNVGVETVGYQKAFIYMLDAEMKRRGKRLNIMELKAKGNKMERAQGFLPYVEQHKFFVTPDMTSLIEQMTSFPFAKHDDLVDCVTYSVQLLHPYRTDDSKRKRVYEPRNPITGY